MIKIFLEGLFKSFKAATVTHDTYSITFGIFISTVGTILSYLLGGIDYALLMLVGLVVMDYTTGLLSAIKHKRLNSDSMYWGIIRKVSQFVIVGFGVGLDRLVGNDSFVFRLMVIYFYIGMEGISLLENFVELGVPVPQKLVEILEQIRKEEVSISQIKDETNAKLDDFSIKKKRYRKDD
jgi:toxin secretion/phage lysis holin